MKTRAPDITSVASVVHRLAVLMAAGVPSVTAWGYLESGAMTIRIAKRKGIGIPDAIVEESEALALATGMSTTEVRAWRGVAAAWSVATDAGAPLAPTLRHFAQSLRDVAQAQRDIAVALAAPVATARLVIGLPPVGILFGMVLGFNTLGTLFTTPLGWACLAIGSSLLVGARAWNRSLVRSAQPRNLTPGLEFDLTAIAVSGGSALDRARASVNSALTRFGIESRDGDGVAVVLDLSRRAGVPAAELLRSEAEERRRSALADSQQQAQALGIRLMVPLGVCVLPAFMILAVVPLFVTVVSSTSIG